MNPKQYNKYLPNSYQSPNHFVDDGIIALLTGEEVKLLVVAQRHIMGWEEHRKTRSDRISLSTFLKESGLNINTIQKYLPNLEHFNIMKCVEKGTVHGESSLYELNLSQLGEIRRDLLEKREQERLTKSRKRTAKSIEIMQEKRKAISSDDTDIPVSCHDTEAISSDDTEVYHGMIEQNKGNSETHIVDSSPDGITGGKEFAAPEPIYYDEENVPSPSLFDKVWKVGVKVNPNMQAMNYKAIQILQKFDLPQPLEERRKAIDAIFREYVNAYDETWLLDTAESYFRSKQDKDGEPINHAEVVLYGLDKVSPLKGLREMEADRQKGRDAIEATRRMMKELIPKEVHDGLVEQYRKDYEELNAWREEADRKLGRKT